MLYTTPVALLVGIILDCNPAYRQPSCSLALKAVTFKRLRCKLVGCSKQNTSVGEAIERIPCTFHICDYKYCNIEDVDVGPFRGRYKTHKNVKKKYFPNTYICKIPVCY